MNTNDFFYNYKRIVILKHTVFYCFHVNTILSWINYGNCIYNMENGNLYNLVLDVIYHMYVNLVINSKMNFPPICHLKINIVGLA